MIIQEKKINTRVNRGIKWLDKTVGKDWVKKVKLSTLDLSEAKACVCGQVFKDQVSKFGVDDGYDVVVDGHVNGRKKKRGGGCNIFMFIVV